MLKKDSATKNYRNMTGRKVHASAKLKEQFLANARTK
jgi:hypothetical protein